MKKSTFKKFMTAGAVGLALSYAALETAAMFARPHSVYADEPEQRSPFEGKRVVLVPDENAGTGTDTSAGHLEAVGETKNYTPDPYDARIKPVLDKALSFCGLAALAPVLAGISLAVYIDDPGPVIFTQKRVGKNKQYFRMHKFRSMKMGAPHDDPKRSLEDPTQYITRVGRFLRAHSLDELPQIWDIFLGNMSVIGPRPVVWTESDVIAERDKYGVYGVKPGLTGWAQINGRDELDAEEKAMFDAEYLCNESFEFDAGCFFGSLGKIIRDDSIVEGGNDR